VPRLQSATAPKTPLLTKAFALASLSHFLHGLSFHLYLHLPGFLQSLGAAESMIGILFGVGAAFAIATRPVLGHVMDRRGRRIVFVAGGLMSVAMCASYLLVDTIGPLVFLVRMGHGLSEAMLFASLFAFASDIVPATRRIEGIALFGVSGMLPMAMSGLLGDAILRVGGYSELFVASVVFSAAAVALSLPLRDVIRPGEGERPRGLFAALSQPDLLPLWFAGMVFATAIMAHFAFLKTFVLAKGFGSVGLFFSLYAGVAIVLRLGWASLPERIGPKRVLLPALMVTALGFATLALAQNGLHVAIAGLLCGAGHGFTFPILLGLVVTRARPNERGGALSIFTALFDAGMLVGSPVLGAIAERFDYGAMFWCAFAMVVGGSGAFFAWDRAR
jgi:MFS family permease